MNETTDVLVLAPHPDDAEVGCGGLLLLAARSGLRTAVLDATRGEAGTRGSAAARAREARAGARALGLRWRRNLGHPDGALAGARGLDLDLVRAIRRARPSLLLAPYPRDVHPDHEALGKAARRAAYLAGLARVEPALPPFRPARLLHFMEHYRFRPTLVLDISTVWKAKAKAIRCFRSQFPAEGETREHLPAGLDLVERTEVRDRFYGASAGVGYAEPYVSEAPFLFADAAALLGRPGKPRPAPP